MAADTAEQKQIAEQEEAARVAAAKRAASGRQITGTPEEFVRDARARFDVSPEVAAGAFAGETEPLTLAKAQKAIDGFVDRVIELEDSQR